MNKNNNTIKSARRMLTVSIILFVLVLLCIGGCLLWYFLKPSAATPVTQCPRPQPCPACPPCPKPPPSPPIITPPPSSQPISDPVTVRDRAALGDPLYPPLNRQPRFAQEDTYRMVGYLVNPADKEDTWKLFAREKRRGIGEFYVSSANKNMDVKITLTNEIVAPPTKLRDVYDIPSELRLHHPLFSPDASYQVITNPQADLGASNIYV